MASALGVLQAPSLALSRSSESVVPHSWPEQPSAVRAVELIVQPPSAPASSGAAASPASLSAPASLGNTGEPPSAEGTPRPASPKKPPLGPSLPSPAGFGPRS